MNLFSQIYRQEAVTNLLKPKNVKKAFRRRKGIVTNEARQISNKNIGEKEAEILLEETGESTKLNHRSAVIFPTESLQ